MNDEAIANMTLPELIELLHRIAEEIELRAMQLAERGQGEIHCKNRP